MTFTSPKEEKDNIYGRKSEKNTTSPLLEQGAYNIYRKIYYGNQKSKQKEEVHETHSLGWPLKALEGAKSSRHYFSGH